MNPIAQYPVFEENQVLTAKNLNDVVAFLNEQDLASRRNLHGIGIVCGMKLSSDLSSWVEITKGCGVTSLGHLITVPDMNLPYYRTYTDPASPPYNKFRKSENEQYPLWELFTEEEFILAKEPENIKKLSSAEAPNLNDKAVIIYLEIFDHDPDSCIAEDCDQLATVRLYNLRKLLIKKGDLLAIINKSLFGKDLNSYLTAGDLFGEINPQCKLPTLVNHRLNKNLSDLTSLNLGQINSWDKLKSTYKNIIEADVIKISKALYTSYEAYAAELDQQYNGVNPFPKFDEGDISANPLYEIILQQVEKEKDMLNLQYAYDFLHDLSKAFTEFSDIATEYSGRCCPDITKFPLHLMLGLLDKSNPQEDLAFRHKWQPSPASNDMKDLLEELRMLHYKMYIMVVHFQLRNFTSLDHIRITPGKFTCNPFSKHSAAHYYMKDIEKEKLVTAFWNYRLTKSCKQDTVLSYFPELYSNKQFVTNPLLYSLRDYNYFRIEGHIGQEYKSVKQKIESEIRNFNLPFDIIGIKLAGDHLDVEIDEHCFDDIQTMYKVNRDEYLACLLAIYNPIKNFIDAVQAMNEKQKLAFLNTPIPEGFSISFIKTFHDLFNIIAMYGNALKATIDQLPEHVSDFDIKTFLPANFIASAYSLILSIVLEFISNLAKQIPMFMYLVVIRTFFDKMLDDCTGAKFKSIYELYQERLIRTQMGRLFPGYVTGSPGMEHIAGVKEGGTFILVYDEMPEAEPIRPHRPRPGRIPLDPCFENEQARMVELRILQNFYMMRVAPDFYQQYQFAIDPDEQEETGGDEGGNENLGEEGGMKKKIFIKMPDNHMEAQINKLPPRYQTRAGILGTLFPGFDKEEEEEEKVYRVVADFAIPYRCCKSCLKADKPEEPPTTELSIKMEDDIEKFCFYKTEAYTVHVEPAVEEGVLTSSAGGVEQGGDGSWHFFPNKTDWTQEEVTLTYTVGEESIDKVIVVFKPIAKIITKNFPQKEVFVLENHSENADHYLWVVPELSIHQTEEDKVHLPIPYELIRKFQPKVIRPSLTAYRGECEHTDGFTIKVDDIFEGGGEVETPVGRFDVEKYEGRSDYKYKNNEKKQYRFTLLPPGGELKGLEKCLVKEGSNYFFKPTGLPYGDYTYQYGKQKLILKVVRSFVTLPPGFGGIIGRIPRPPKAEDFLSKVGYKEDERIVGFDNLLVKDVSNKKSAENDFLAGKKTSEIGREYKEALDNTVVMIKKAHEEGETEATDYLMNTYIEMLDRVAVTTEALGENVKKSHGVYKRMEEAEKNLTELKTLGVNVNPDNKLKKLIDNKTSTGKSENVRKPISKLKKVLK